MCGRVCVCMCERVPWSSFDSLGRPKLQGPMPKIKQMVIMKIVGIGVTPRVHSFIESWRGTALSETGGHTVVPLIW